MDASRIERIKQLFDQLIALPGDQREPWLSAQPEVDHATRRYLHDLLAADAQVNDLTAWPALRPGTSSIDWLGRRIGPYEVVRELGRGGMGSVFLARRIDGGVEQQVAIKIVRPERLDASTLARFRLERQVLALLQHPNIAAMLDLGELPDGSPYAVMEYVAGTPLGDYIREHSPDRRQRLELFLSLCDAVAYAHANMVVHRDLKPSNVLVDNKGRPRLLDFGIAKPLQSRLGAIEVEETTAENRYFSLAHAAPEQLRENGRIGAACDIYGLGTLLYQLLAGVPPFALDGRSPAELERDILEKDPLPPSRRAAAARTAEATRFPIARDLDLIVLRCLRKNPADRYASVDQLAADVRNYLAGRPVIAREGNTFYRLGRFVSRHRLAVAMSAALLGSAGAGAALVWQQQLATAEQRIRAEEMTTLISDSIATLDPNKSNRTLSARDVFERVAAQAKASPSLTAGSRARVLTAIAAINMDLGLPDNADRLLGSVDVSLLSPEEHNTVLVTKARIARALGHFDISGKLLAEGLADAKDTATRGQWQLMDVDNELAQGHMDEALRKLDAIDAKPLPAVQQEQHGMLRGKIYLSHPDPALRAKAADELRHVLQARESRLGAESPAAFFTLGYLNLIAVRTGDLAEARKISSRYLNLAEAVFGTHSVHYAEALSAASLTERFSGNYARSLEMELQSIDGFKTHVGELSPQVTKAYLNLGGLYEELDNLPEAERYFRAASDNAAKIWPASDLNTFMFRLDYARFLAEHDKIPAGQAQAKIALADAETFPQLKEYDSYPFALLIDKVGDYHSKPSTENRNALTHAMRHMIDNAAGSNIKRGTTRLVAKLKTLGIEPDPAEAAASEGEQPGK